MQIKFPTSQAVRIQVDGETAYEYQTCLEELSRVTGGSRPDISTEFWADFLQKLNPQFNIKYRRGEIRTVPLELVGQICNFSEDACEAMQFLVAHHTRSRLSTLIRAYDPETGIVEKPQVEEMGSLGRTLQDNLIEMLAFKEGFRSIRLPFPWFPTIVNPWLTQVYFNFLRSLGKPLPYFVIKEILGYGEWPLPRHYKPSNWVWWNRYNHVNLPTRSWNLIFEQLQKEGFTPDKFLLSSGMGSVDLMEFFLSNDRLKHSGIEVWNFYSEGVLLGIPESLGRLELVAIFEEEMTVLGRGKSWYPERVINV